ncbi:MAG: ABC transporter ATP-binding protein [Rickettsiales bacterium]|jgi:lipoprotein-releasing system ATP-binding protein|nr:ABC transporter ATP-binding protein [Rickettsiales bacterium]
MTGILKSLSKISDKKMVLSARDVGKTFIDGNGQPLAILRGGGFDLRRGEILALVGPSGCGKTTLLQCVGLLDRPTRGQILIAGTAAQKLSESERTLVRRNKIGFVYQRNNLLSDFSALENVAMPIMTTGGDAKAAEKTAMKLLKMVNMSARAQHLPSALSGGEQQRVAVARALANNPDIILADEPTGSLDPVHAKIVFDLLFKIVRETGTAMLFVTHDMNLAARADRAITIKNGMIVSK